MSVETWNWALNLAPVPYDSTGPNPACAAVLLGLANHANPDGTNAFPSAGTLVRYSRASERTVRTALDRLEAEGIISPCDPEVIRATIKRADRQPKGWNLDITQIRTDLTEWDLKALERLFHGIRDRFAAALADEAVKADAAVAFLLVHLAAEKGSGGPVLTAADAMRYARLRAEALGAALDRLVDAGTLTHHDDPAGWLVDPRDIAEAFPAGRLAELEQQAPKLRARIAVTFAEERKRDGRKKGGGLVRVPLPARRTRKNAPTSGNTHGVQPLHPAADEVQPPHPASSRGATTSANGVQPPQERGAAVAPEPDFEPSMEPPPPGNHPGDGADGTGGPVDGHEGGKTSPTNTPDPTPERSGLDDLVDAVLDIRPHWSPADVRDELVAAVRRHSRGTGVAGACLIALARGRYGRTDGPGRLNTAGPWWEDLAGKTWRQLLDEPDPTPASAPAGSMAGRSAAVLPPGVAQCRKHRGEPEHNCGRCKAEALSDPNADRPVGAVMPADAARAVIARALSSNGRPGGKRRGRQRPATKAAG